MLYKFNRVKNNQFFFSLIEVSVAVVIKKSMNTTTAKLLKKSEKRVRLKNITFEKTSELIALHQCDDQKCSNFDQYC